MVTLALVYWVSEKEVVKNFGFKIFIDFIYYIPDNQSCF